VRLKLLGEPQADNALAAIAAVGVTGGDVSAAIGGVSTLEKIPGRMERVDVGQPFLAFVDYMHNTAGQHRIYPFLRSLTERRVITVIGATGDRDPGKRAPLGFTAARVADVVIITDESPFSEDPDALRSEVVRGAQAAGRAEVLVQPDRARAIELAVNIAEKGDVLVVAGRGHTATLVSGERAERFDDRTVVRDAILNLERHSDTQLPTEGNGRQL
jgi:UDP-N-acetylmuramoyl-L-alanyl-D-glutamate--2,6-diaminopimelate ligase